MKIGLTNLQDLLALLVRRKWWVIAPFLALTCAVALLTKYLPKTYVSETLILVRSRDVPEEFVKDLIVGTPEVRLRAIEQTVLSRTNLVEILREFSDRLPSISGLNMDDKVAMLRSQINVVFEIQKSESTRGDLPLTFFRISYQNQDPELAQKITSKLTALFIQQDNRVRETQVVGTTEFLSGEFDKISEQLRESETKLKEVKISRQFELPDQREANLRTLDRLALDKKANGEALDRENAIRFNLEAEISQTPAMIQKTVPTTGALSPNPKLEEYRKAQQEYDDLASRYTAKHPDVQAAKNRMERIKEQIPVDQLTSANSTQTKETPMEPNPKYQQLAEQLGIVKTEIGIKEKDKSWLESEIAKYSQRVENTPKTEQDIAEVVRGNDDLKKQYDDLKNKLSQARLAESLESKQKGGQFEIVDPANYPLVPAKPNKTAVLFGGAVGSLLLSIALAILVDVARQKIWTQSQIEALWNVPVLIDVPEILTDADLAALGRKKYVNAVTSLAGVIVWSGCLYGMYLKHDFIIRHLDPVLQKIVYK